MSYTARPGMLRLDVTDALCALDLVRRRVRRGDAVGVPLVELRQAVSTARLAKSRAEDLIAQLSHEVRRREREERTDV